MDTLLLAMTIMATVLILAVRAICDLPMTLKRWAFALDRWNATLARRTEDTYRRAYAKRGITFPVFCSWCGNPYVTGEVKCQSCSRPRFARSA